MKQKCKRFKTPYTDYAKRYGKKLTRFWVSFSVEAIILVISILSIKAVFNMVVPQGALLSSVEGSSMEPTLHDGQYIFPEKGTVKRGDIITTRICEEGQTDKIVVKRVIGIPGDKIKITKEGVFVNEEMISEEYVSQELKKFTYLENGYNDIVLAKNEYYIMGDNREDSYDSRFFGPVEEQNLIYRQFEKTTKYFWRMILLLCGIALVIGIIFSLTESALMEEIYKRIYKNEHSQSIQSKKDE